MDQEQKIRLARQFISGLPYARALALEMEDIGDGRAVISMPYDPKLVGDPATGVIHGGAVSGLMDTTGGAAVMSHPSSPGGTATIDLRIDYNAVGVARPDDRGQSRSLSHHAQRGICKGCRPG